MFNSPSNADGTWSYGARADSDIEIGEKFGSACFEDPLQEHTVEFLKGNTVTVDQTRAATFRVGVDIGPLSVGSTSGYSTNVQMHWNMKRGGTWFCGRDDYPLGTDPGPGFIWNANK